MNAFNLIEGALSSLREQVSSLETENRKLSQEIASLKDEIPEEFTTDELATKKKIHPGTLARWRVEGRGPKFVKQGTKVVYLRSDIEEWENENKKRSTVG